MTVPHHFPSLVEGPAQAVIIVGAGLSCPDLPIVNGLVGRLEEVANSLGVTTIVAQGDDEYFYALAEAVLNAQGDTGENRLRLAENLGLLDDRRWFGEIGMPLSGNTPRHRAIARFAVEKRLRSIISLNWDALLETALESIGLANGPKVSRPWDVTAHASVVDDTHLPALSGAHVFPVIKPHGCVRDLEKARRNLHLNGIVPNIIFKLAQSELRGLPNGQRSVDKKVEIYVSECPLISVGWRALEKYLRDTVISAANPARRVETDAITVVDIAWDTNHDKISAAYGKSKVDSFAEVKPNVPPTTDCMFQWLQARYALSRLMAVAPATYQAALQQQLQQLDQPGCDHYILNWVDKWLPAWVRLCWRAGVMGGIDPQTNRRIEPWEIPVMPRDVHVPLGGLSLERRDLQAAVKLLFILNDDLNRFNFDMFPGGFWDGRNRYLYIPLPGWRGTTQSSSLVALQPLIEAMQGLGFVKKIYLVWLDVEDTPPDETLRIQLKAQLLRLMPLINFAEKDAVEWANLQDMKGGLKCKHGLSVVKTG